jgi:hypothetical protein
VPGPERRLVALPAPLIDLEALAEPDPGPPPHLARSLGPARKPRAKVAPKAGRKRARV